MTAVVEATDLRKSYGGVAAVRGVSFAIREGECYGFLGPNGAGKTTTMKMICGRIAKSSGALRVAGLDADPANMEIKRRIGVVGQETALDPELDVLENLVQYALYFDLGFRAARERAEELLAFVQLDGKARARTAELSGGMKRRLMLARALVNRPRILVLDEPTTGLDPQARLVVWDRLHALRRDGVTILLTTHYMDEASRLADRVAVMFDGRILCEGAPGALIAERMEPQVLELPGEVAAGLEAALEGLATRITRHGGRLHAFGPDAAAMLARIEAAGGAPALRLIRPANLEDLFLKLTGAELSE